MAKINDATSAMETLKSDVVFVLALLVGCFVVSGCISLVLFKLRIIPKWLIQGVTALITLFLGYLAMQTFIIN